MSETLKQLRKKVDAKRAQLRDLFKQTKVDGDDGEKRYDFEKAEADWLPDDVAKLEGNAKSLRICEVVGTANDELDELQDELTVRETADNAAKALAKRDKEPVSRPPHPGKGAGEPEPERKGFGEMITEHPNWEMWQKSGFTPGACPAIEFKDVGIRELKALFETTPGSGWPTESTRTGRVVDAVTRPLQLIDILPTGQTGQANVVYMEETTRTHAAAEKAEGAAYAESEFVLTEATSPVRKITDSVPVTDEQLEDVPMAQSYLEGRVGFGIMQRLDGQAIAGDGIAPNLDGIINVGGIQTQARGADPVPDAIYKAGTLVRVTGRAIPTHVLLHPNDAQDIRLTRTADGIYIWGNPSEAGTPRIWGWPIIENESLTENTGLVGSFMPLWIQLVERRGVMIEIGFVNDDFTKGRKTLRGSGRWAYPVYRPPAFCTVTGI